MTNGETGLGVAIRSGRPTDGGLDGRVLVGDAAGPARVSESFIAPTGANESMTNASANRESSVPLATVRNSVPLKIAIVGILFAAVGAIVQDGASAAFVFIWGIAFFTIGLVTHLVIRYNQPN